MVRPATHDDIPAILDLGERFHALSPWRDRPFSRDATEQTVRALIDNEDACLFFNGAGILGGVLSQIYFGGGLIAQEAFWFADKGGRELLDAFEAWAAQKGACGVIMVHLALNDRADAVMGAMYARRGYALRESHYFKELA